jgi:hypothetical protein
MTRLNNLRNSQRMLSRRRVLVCKDTLAVQRGSAASERCTGAKGDIRNAQGNVEGGT